MSAVFQLCISIFWQGVWRDQTLHITRLHMIYITHIFEPVRGWERMSRTFILPHGRGRLSCEIFFIPNLTPQMKYWKAPHPPGGVAWSCKIFSFLKSTYRWNVGKQPRLATFLPGWSQLHRTLSLSIWSSYFPCIWKQRQFSTCVLSLA